MTQEQFSKYKELKNDVDAVKDFLFWCGNRYHGKVVSRPRFRLIIKRLRKVFLYRNWHAAGLEENLYEIPADLQERIVGVVEQWVDEKEAELLKI